MSSARQGSGRASGAVMVLIVLLALIGVGAFAGHGVLQAKWLEVDAQQGQLDILKRRRPAQSQGAEEAPITVKPFLGEESFALAANALQKRIVSAIEEVDGKLVTVNVDPPITGDEELARRISVQVTAELTNDALQKVLYQLESGVPFSFIDSFSVSRTEARDAAAKDEAQVEPRLSVSMSVTGYRRKGSR